MTVAERLNAEVAEAMRLAASEPPVEPAGVTPVTPAPVPAPRARPFKGQVVAPCTGCGVYFVGFRSLRAGQCPRCRELVR